MSDWNLQDYKIEAYGTVVNPPDAETEEDPSEQEEDVTDDDRC